MLKQVSTLLFAFSLFATTAVNGQIEHEGEPYAWHDKNIERFNVEYYTTDLLDLDLLAAEDAVTDQYKEAPFRFGYEWEVSLTRHNSGQSSTLEDGTTLWQLGVHCPQATSISFIFDRFKLAHGAELYVWNEDRSTFKGAFTSENNKTWGSFAIGLLDGENVIIELREPSNVAGKSIVELTKIVHGYRSILPYAEEAYQDANRGPFGNSGACNINVNCPEGDPWQIEKRSVALIVDGGFAVCSGALVNNTAQDGTPYFLTANHCLGGQNNWVFYFNHESASCAGSNGPTNQSISGSTLVASNGGSDFALLELSSTPPANYNVQYAGWDNSDAQNVQNATGIHHPSGDVKKICFEEDNPYHENEGGAAVWYIDQWEDGVTEGGSSGSPLFDHNHRIIGQLYGGYAACDGNVNNGEEDYYGRFGVSWDGNSASSRLRDWLDPINSGATILDGFPIGFETFAYDVVAGAINGVDNVVCGNTVYPVLNVSNIGTTTITSMTIDVQLNGTTVETINWSGNLAQFGNVNINLSAMTVGNGSNTITCILSGPNSEADENVGNNSSSFTFEANTGPSLTYTLELTLDDYGSETTWELRNAANQVVYEGGPYSDGADQTVEEIDMCIAEGCYTFIIYDSWGDGICCDWGDGSYTLYNNLGQAFANGGVFGDLDEVDFCTQNLSITEENAFGFALFPNPSDASVNIELKNGAERVSVYSATGQLLLDLPVQQNDRQLVLNTSMLPAGWYNVQVSGNAFRMSEQLIIQH